MTEIHILPVRSHSTDQVARLSADLAAARERGLDLGSRATHIQAHGEALLSLSRDLENAFAALRLTLCQLGVQDQHAQDTIKRLISGIQMLAASATRYPKGL